MGSVLIGSGTWFAPAGGIVPVNTVAPTISGTPQVGVALTGSDGTWTGPVDSTERVWQLSANGTSGWADIPGATATTYTPVTGDATKYVRFGVRKTGPGGTSSWVYSAASGQIAAAGATPLLSASDITLDGYFHVSTGPSGADPYWGVQMAVRRVGGAPRAILSFFQGFNNPHRWVEIDLSGAINSSISSLTNTWTTPTDDTVLYRPGSGAGWTYGTQENFVWDEANQQVIRTYYDGYPEAANPARAEVITLNGDGTLGLVKRVTIGGKNDGSLVGGPSIVPADFQSDYGVGPIAFGTGGYRSLVGQYDGGTFGFTSYTTPALSGYANGATIPSGDIKTLAYRTTAASQSSYRAWRGYTFTPDGGDVDLPSYPNTPTGTFSGDGPLNYFDGGDTRPNGTGAGTNGAIPNFEPLFTKHTFWADMPSGSGRTRQIYNDIYANKAFVYGVGFSKRGVIAPFYGGYGRCWYATSAVATEKRGLELHIFDPVHLGEVALGTRTTHDVHPVAYVPIDVGAAANTFGTPQLPTSGWDPVGKKLYLGVFSSTWPTGPSSGFRILRFSVNA